MKPTPTPTPTPKPMKKNKKSAPLDERPSRGATTFSDLNALREQSRRTKDVAVFDTHSYYIPRVFGQEGLHCKMNRINYGNLPSLWRQDHF
jgi:hypothetical protein